LKLSSLFAKYLYQYKTLRLPGIGIFTLDPSVSIPDPNDKLFPDFLQNIRYSQQPVNAPDEDFINFIRTETGKIKPLAESDLDSYLSDGKILLNIGKPFHIEGIGFLQKTREGVLEFKAGDPLQYKSETHHTEVEEPVERSKTFYLDTKPSNTGGRKLLIALGAIAGIVIVIWGGYKLYNRNGNSSTPIVADTATVLSSDTMAISSMPDSFQRASTDSTANRSTYKFIIERTANKARALRRYNQLQEHLADVQLETQDSTLFKLYFVLPATPADTARIRDSLKSWYGRRVVYVE
jgi:hypothetical protein